MQLISFGFYSLNDFKIFEKIINNYNEVLLENNYINIEKESGESFLKLKKKFNLSEFTTLIKKVEERNGYHSYELVQEISNYYISKEHKKINCEYPMFFKICTHLLSSNVEKFVLVFSEVFDSETSIRIEEILFDKLIERLYNAYVWEEQYFDLYQNVFYDDTSHPLVLIVNSKVDGKFTI